MFCLPCKKWPHFPTTDPQFSMHFLCEVGKFTASAFINLAALPPLCEWNVCGTLKNNLHGNVAFYFICATIIETRVILVEYLWGTCKNVLRPINKSTCVWLYQNTINWILNFFFLSTASILIVYVVRRYEASSSIECLHTLYPFGTLLFVSFRFVLNSGILSASFVSKRSFCIRNAYFVSLEIVFFFIHFCFTFWFVSL